MKDVVLAQIGSAEWQTPRHGDFARYVEQLTGGQARVTLDEPGRVRRLSERSARVQSVLGSSSSVEPVQTQALRSPAGTLTEFAELRGSVTSVLGAVRWGLLLLTLVQVGLLIVLSLGSLVGIGASFVIWWLAGRMKRAVEGASGQNGSGEAALAAVRRELQTRADTGVSPRRRG